MLAGTLNSKLCETGFGGNVGEFHQIKRNGYGFRDLGIQDKNEFRNLGINQLNSSILQFLNFARNLGINP
jgi:hypothetical protein